MGLRAVQVLRGLQGPCESTGSFRRIVRPMMRSRRAAPRKILPAVRTATARRPSAWLCSGGAGVEFMECAADVPGGSGDGNTRMTKGARRRPSC